MANYDAIFDQIYNSLPDVEAKLNEMKENDLKALQQQRDAQDKRLAQERDAALRQAYITQEMNKRDLPTWMAAQGLTGGITETAANDILRGYRNSANGARKTYTNAYTDLSNTYNVNEASLNSEYGQRIIDALAQKRAEATDRAQIAYQIRQAEEAAAAAAWAAAEKAASQPTAGPGGKDVDDTIIHEPAPYNTKTTNNYASQNQSGIYDNPYQRKSNNYSWQNTSYYGKPSSLGAAGKAKAGLGTLYIWK